MKVRPKKYLGQHFLKDQNIARKIAGSLTGYENYSQIAELGPGAGVLTQYLIEKSYKHIFLVEIDQESIEYLEHHFDDQKLSIIGADFLKTNLDFLQPSTALIGNFPYHISSQIFFKVLEHKEYIPEVVGMIQKEVAQRICANEGSKTYGILSVLLGAFYTREILFHVPPGVFNPPPKVDSSVIRLQRKPNVALPCSESLLFRVVKQGFQNRRKTLRNALKPLNLPAQFSKDPILSKRAEQLSIQSFIALTAKIESLWNQ
ncbi:MAG TPA: 16S rRNA (adenine(1518)-N(6)/adenine(1519)-N(6))-dimethyltransferase [Cytophagales bacterium]|nr:16S rRNA (adenine(1518)-N(6)/adenine(1519)-N(6))-dimethyltransferase [Cytophagales bacterium]